jgi:hypothetical protein
LVYIHPDSGIKLATPVLESQITNDESLNIMSSPTVRSTIPASLLLALSGWAGLGYLFSSTLPTLWPRWLFFFFCVLGVTGLFLPVSAFLNRRFPTQPQASLNAVIREALLGGIYFSTLAWLQLGRVLTMPVIILLAVGITLIEFLIRLREKSRWEP